MAPQPPKSPFEKPGFPMRINKYLAHKGFSTRRGVDELVARGKVTINGKRAELGAKVEEGDSVKVAGGKDVKGFRYFAYYKPLGVITSLAGEGEEDIMSTVRIPGVFPLGRLDKNSQGLILLTDDGRVTDRLLNPENAHEKEYAVKVKDKLRSSFEAKMEKGVNIEGYVTKPCKVEIVNENSFKVILTEGKKHQIRRMCVALFQEVSDLKRVRIENITLESLKPGAYRAIGGAELALFLKRLGL